jgi:hypothetical protein
MIIYTFQDIYNPKKLFNYNLREVAKKTYINREDSNQTALDTLAENPHNTRLRR